MTFVTPFILEGVKQLSKWIPELKLVLDSSFFFNMTRIHKILPKDKKEEEIGRYCWCCCNNNDDGDIHDYRNV